MKLGTSSASNVVCTGTSLIKHITEEASTVRPHISEATVKPEGPRQLIAGTVHVTTSSDCSQLVGNCPTCNSRLSVEVRSDGTFGSLVACMRCKQIYRVQPQEGSTSLGENPRGFSVSYVVVGPWDASAIMEYLFDNVGPVSPVTGGFVCQPDENHVDFPFITVNQGARTIRFGLFGQYQENEAAFRKTAEAQLVDLLRERGKAVISLVAESDGKVIGHILFSPVVVASPMGFPTPTQRLPSGFRSG
jgi:hypothetical protein